MKTSVYIKDCLHGNDCRAADSHHQKRFFEKHEIEDASNAITVCRMFERIVFPLKAWSYFFLMETSSRILFGMTRSVTALPALPTKISSKTLFTADTYEWQKRRDKPFNDDTTILTMKKTHKYFSHFEASKRKQRLKRAV